MSKLETEVRSLSNYYFLQIQYSGFFVTKIFKMSLFDPRFDSFYYRTTKN